MKRREFLVGSAGIASTLPLVGLAKPCPPPQVSIKNGRSVGTPCTNITQQQDWINRSTGPGVVWAHNFTNAAEVNQFRVNHSTGYVDPVENGSNVYLDPTDGFAGGGCLSIEIPTGSSGANGSWSRPMGAYHAGQPSGGGMGNGLSTDDPAASGTLTVRDWNSSATNQLYVTRTGYYANPAVQSHFPYWPTQGTTEIYDGSSFFLQFRCKISASRWTSGNPPGKLVLLEPAAELSALHVIVIRSESTTGNGNASGLTYAQTNAFNMYTSRGVYANSDICDPQGTTYAGSTVVEPGGAFAATCTGSNTSKVGSCWEWPADTWVTILMQMAPGQDNSNYTGNAPSGALSTWPYHDTVINVWAALPQDTSYTQIWGMNNIALFYYTDAGVATNGPNGMWHPPAYNVVTFSGYMNNQMIANGWSQKFTQVIFSKQFIPCPGA